MPEGVHYLETHKHAFLLGSVKSLERLLIYKYVQSTKRVRSSNAFYCVEYTYRLVVHNCTRVIYMYALSKCSLCFSM